MTNKKLSHKQSYDKCYTAEGGHYLVNCWSLIRCWWRHTITSNTILNNHSTALLFKHRQPPNYSSRGDAAYTAMSLYAPSVSVSAIWSIMPVFHCPPTEFSWSVNVSHPISGEPLVYSYTYIRISCITNCTLYTTQWLRTAQTNKHIIHNYCGSVSTGEFLTILLILICILCIM